jgi:hypothetical protein
MLIERIYIFIIIIITELINYLAFSLALLAIEFNTQSRKCTASLPHPRAAAFQMAAIAFF